MITIRVTRTRDVLSLVIRFQPGASLGILNGLDLLGLLLLIIPLSKLEAKKNSSLRKRSSRTESTMRLNLPKSNPQVIALIFQHNTAITLLSQF